MKNPTLRTLLLCLTPLAVSAQQTLIFQDTFENRTAGTQLDGSTSSDGNVEWIAGAPGADNITIGDDSGNKFVQDIAGDTDNSVVRARLASDLSKSIEESDFLLEFDYRYLTSFNDNLQFNVQYRLADDFLSLFDGGDIPGYRLSLSADNSTNPDSVQWAIETDPQGTGTSLGSGTFDVSNLVVSGNNTPGAPLSVALEVVGTQHKLTLNGTEVLNVTDTQFNDPSEGAVSFFFNGSRNRGFDNVSLSSIPEVSSFSAILGGLVLGLVYARRKR